MAITAIDRNDIHGLYIDSTTQILLIFVIKLFSNIGVRNILIIFEENSSKTEKKISAEEKDKVLSYTCWIISIYYVICG